MTLQLRTSRMKKRLSSFSWHLISGAIALSLVAIIMGYCFWAIAPQTRIGIVPAEFPSVSIVRAPSSQREPRIEDKVITLNDQTLVVTLTERSFVIGAAQDFAKGFFGTNNKVMIPHLDGAPLLSNLAVAIEGWAFSKKIPPQKATAAIILVPAPHIPMPIVIKTVDYLRKKLNSRAVILANGFA
jgi:hypothetical protein